MGQGGGANGGGANGGGANGGGANGARGLCKRGVTPTHGGGRSGDMGRDQLTPDPRRTLRLEHS